MTVKEKLKDIFTQKPERMSRLVKWALALPMAYITYLVLMLLVPVFESTMVNSIIRYILLSLCILLMTKYFLKFDIKKLLSEDGFINILKIAFYALLMLVLGFVTTYIWKLCKPSDFQYIGFSSSYISSWILSFVLVVSAAFNEELIFRCYVSHFLNENLEEDPKKQLLYCIISALLFCIAHFANPETSSSFIVSMLFYFIMGFSFMAFYLSDKGIEIPLGLHIGNNLLTAWFFGYDNAVLETKTIFINHNAVSMIVVLQCALCLLICFLIYSRKRNKA